MVRQHKAVELLGLIQLQLVAVAAGLVVVVQVLVVLVVVAHLLTYPPIP